MARIQINVIADTTPDTTSRYPQLRTFHWIRNGSIMVPHDRETPPDPSNLPLEGFVPKRADDIWVRPEV